VTTSPAQKKSRKVYALLVNTKSRRGAEWFARAKAAIAESRHDLIAAEEISQPGQLPEQLKKLIAKKPDVLVVGGGDGTVSLAASLLVGGKIRLALLPLGTTNNFARTANVPLAFDEAMTVALGGKTARFDVGKAGDKYFVNVASLGLSAKIADRVSDKNKKHFGRAAYAFAGLRELILHRPVRCSIVADGKTYELRTNQLIIANGGYHSAIEISENTSAQSGKLVVFNMDNGSKLKLLMNLVHFYSHGIKTMTGHEVIRARRLQLTTVPKRKLELDGEPFAATPTTLECRPGAVVLLVP
jgi:diacylglycerol kinase (ATP)